MRGLIVKKLNAFVLVSHSGLDPACPVLDTGNPVFEIPVPCFRRDDVWIPPGVYPDEDRGRNGTFTMIHVAVYSRVDPVPISYLIDPLDQYKEFGVKKNTVFIFIRWYRVDLIL